MKNEQLKNKIKLALACEKAAQEAAKDQYAFTGFPAWVPLDKYTDLAKAFEFYARVGSKETFQYLQRHAELKNYS